MDEQAQFFDYSAPIDDGRRNCGRFRCAGIRVDSPDGRFGEAINMSSGGMLVLAKRPIVMPESRLLRVRVANKDVAFETEVRLSWGRKIGFRKVLYGCQFTQLTDEVNDKIHTLFEKAKVDRTFDEWEDAA